MTRLIKFTIAAMLIWALAGCRPASVATRADRSDSIVYRERVTVKDSLIAVPMPADSSMLRALVECDSLNNAYISSIVELRSGSRSSASVKLENKVLTVDCHCDSLTIYSIYHARYQYIAESAVSRTSSNTEVTSRPWWLSNWAGVLAISLLSAIAILLSLNTILTNVKKNSETR